MEVHVARLVGERHDALGQLQPPQALERGRHLRDQGFVDVERQTLEREREAAQTRGRSQRFERAIRKLTRPGEIPRDHRDDPALLEIADALVGVDEQMRPVPPRNRRRQLGGVGVMGHLQRLDLHALSLPELSEHLFERDLLVTAVGVPDREGLLCPRARRHAQEEQ